MESQECESLTQSGTEDKEIIISLTTQLEALQAQLEDLQTLTHKNESTWQIRHDEMVVQCENHKTENVVLRKDVENLKSELKVKIDHLSDVERKCEQLTEVLNLEKQSNSSTVIDQETQLEDLKNEIKTLTCVLRDSDSERQSEEKATDLTNVNTQCEAQQDQEGSDGVSWQDKYNEMVELNEKQKYENLVLQDILEELKADLKSKDEIKGQTSSSSYLIEQNDNVTQTRADRDALIADLKLQIENLQTERNSSETSWQVKYDELTLQCGQYKSDILLLQDKVEKLNGDWEVKCGLLSDVEGKHKQVGEELQQEKQVVSDLEKQLHTLENEKEEHISNFNDLVKRYETITQTVTEKETIITDLTQRCEDLHQTMTANETTITDLRAQYEQQQTVINNKESLWQVKYNDLMLDYEDHKCENQKLHLSLGELKTDLESKNMLIMDVETKYKQASEKLSEMRLDSEMVVELEAELQTRKGDMDAQTCRLEDITQQCDDLRQTVSEKENIISDLTQQCDGLSHDVSEKEKRIVDLTQQGGNFNETVAEKEKMISDLTQQCDGLTQSVSEKEKMISDLTQQCDGLTETVSEKEKMISDLTQQCDGLTQSVSEKEKMISDLTQQCDGMTQSVSEKEKMISDLTQQCDGLTETVSEKEKMISDLTQQCDGMTQSVSEKEKMISDLTQQCDGLTESVSEKEKMISDLTQQCDGLTESVSEKEKMISDLTQQCDGLTQSVSEKEKMISDLTQQCDGMTQSVSEKEKMISDLTQQCDGLTESVSEKEKMISDLTQQCDGLTESVSEKEKMISDLTQQCDGLTESVSEKEKMISDLTQQCDGLTESVSEKEKMISDLTQQCDGMTQSVSEKEKMISDLTQQCDGMTQSVSEKEKMISDLTQQCDGLTQSVSEKEKMIVDLTQQGGNFNETVAQKEKIISDLTHNVSEKEKIIADLTQQVGDFTQTVTQKEMMIADLTQQCVGLNQVVTEKESRIIDLKTELETQQTLISSNELSSKAKYNDLMQDYENYKSEQQNLYQSLEELQTDLASKNMLLMDLESKFKQASEELSEKKMNSGMVEDLERMLQTMKGEVEAKMSNVEDLTQNCKDLSKIVSEKEAMIADLTQQHEITKQTMNDKETVISDLKSHLENFQTMSSTSESSWQVKYDELALQCGQYKRANMLLKDQVEKLNGDLEVKCDLLSDLERKCELASDDLQAKSHELIIALSEKQLQSDIVMDLQNQIRTLKRETEEEASRFEKLSVLVSASQEKCDQLTQMLKVKEVECLECMEAKTSLLLELESKCEQLSTELQDKSYELILALSEQQFNCALVSDLGQKVEALKLELESKSASFDDLQSRWLALNQENLDQQQELSSTKKLFFEMEEKSDLLAHQLKEKEMESYTIASENKSREDRLSQIQNELHEKCEELKAKSEKEMIEGQENVDNSKGEISSELEAERQKCEELRSEIDGLKCQHHELNAAVKSHEAELEIKEHENAEYKQKWEAYEKTINLLTEKCTSLEDEVDFCRNYLNDKEDLIRSHLMEIEEIKAILEDKRKEQEQAENKIELLQQNMVQKNEQLVQSEHKLKQTEDELENWKVLVEERTQLENTTANKSQDPEMVMEVSIASGVDDELKQTKSDTSVHLRQELEYFKQENEALKKERLENNANEECLKMELARFRGDMSSSRLCNESFSTQHFESNEHLWSLTVEKEALQRELDQVRKEFEASKADGMDASNLKEQLAQSQYDIAELRCQVDYLETEKLTIEEDFLGTKQDNTSMNAELQTIKEKNMALENLLQELMATEENLNKEVKQSSEELNDIQEQFENLRNTLGKTGANTSTKGNLRKVQSTSKLVKLSKRDSKPNLDLSHDLKTVTAEKDILKEKIVGLELELHEAKKSLEEGKSTETSHDTNLMDTLTEHGNTSELQNQLLQIQTEKLGLVTDKDSLLEKNKKISDECLRLQDQNKVLEQKIEEFRNAAQDVGNDLRKLHDVVKDQNESLAKKRKEIVAKANEIETLRTDLAELFAKIQGKQKEIDSLSEEVSRMKDELKESKANAGTLEDVVESLNFEMAGLEDDNKSLTSKLETTQEQISDLQRELQVAKQSVEKTDCSINGKEADLSELKNIIEGLKIDNESLNSKLKEINELEDVLRQDIQSSEVMFKSKSTECEDLILQIAETKAEIVNSNEKTVLIQEKLTLSESQLLNLEMQLEEKHKEILILQEEREKACSESNAKEVEITNLVEVNDELKSQLESKQEEMMIVLDEKELLSQRCTEQSETCEALSSSKESLLCQLAEKEEELCNILNRDKDNSESLEYFKASLSAQLKERQDEINRLLQSKENTEGHVSELVDEIKSKDDELQTLSSHLSLVSDELCQSKSSKDSLLAQMREKQNEINQLLQSQQNTEKLISELKDEMKGKDDELQTLSSNLSLLSDELCQSKSGKDEANKEVQRLHNNLSEKETKLKQMEQEHETMLQEFKEAAEKMEREKEELSNKLLETQSTSMGQDSGNVVLKKWEQRCTELQSSLTLERKKCQGLTAQSNSLSEDIEALKSEVRDITKDRDCMRDERQQLFLKAKEHKDRADLLNCRIRVLTHRLKLQDKGKGQTSNSDKNVETKAPVNNIPSANVGPIQSNAQFPSKTDNDCVSKSQGSKLSSVEKQPNENEGNTTPSFKSHTASQEKVKSPEVKKLSSPISSPSFERNNSISPPNKKSSPLSLRRKASKISSAPNLSVLAENKTVIEDSQITSEVNVNVPSVAEVKAEPVSPLERRSTRKRNLSQSSQSSKDECPQGVAPRSLKGSSEPAPRVTRSSALRKRESTESLPSTEESKKSKVIYEDPLTMLEGSTRLTKQDSSVSMMKQSKPSADFDTAGPSTRSKVTPKVLNPITNSPVKGTQPRPKGFLRQTHKMSERKSQATAGKDEAAQNCNTQ